MPYHLTLLSDNYAIHLKQKLTLLKLQAALAAAVGVVVVT
jgi:hypothetical protein